MNAPTGKLLTAGLALDENGDVWHYRGGMEPPVKIAGKAGGGSTVTIDWEAAHGLDGGDEIPMGLWVIFDGTANSWKGPEGMPLTFAVSDGTCTMGHDGTIYPVTLSY